MKNEDRSRSSEEATEPAAPRRSSIRGRISRPNGTPASGALVTVEGNDVPDIAQMTGDDGSFHIGNLGPGRYTIRAHGTVTGSASVDVGDSGEHHVDITADEGDSHGDV